LARKEEGGRERIQIVQETGPSEIWVDKPPGKGPSYSLKRGEKAEKTCFQPRGERGKRAGQGGEG